MYKILNERSVFAKLSLEDDTFSPSFFYFIYIILFVNASVIFTAILLPHTGSGISQRWIFTLMAFLATTIGNGTRVILSITITEMVVPIEKVTEQKDDTCVGFEHPLANNMTVTSSGTYDWDEYTQGLILSSYFWGYATTQFPFGFLSEKFGGKYLLGLGILIPSILTAMIPPAIAWGGSTALIVLRIIIGVTSGSMFPAASTMISRWTTPAERTKCCTFVFAGAVAGTILGTMLPAIIIRYTGMGWQGVFYFSGATGIAWFPFWVLLCYDDPETHPFISDEECKYLSKYSQGQTHKKLPPAPWGRILTSKSVWAFILSLFGIDWIYYTAANDLPKYMSDVVKLSIEENGYLSSLPYLGEWIISGISTWMVNGIIAKQWMSVTNARKLFTTISIMGSACFMLAASYAECNQTLVVIMFFLAMAMMGCCYPSVMINALDLSPNYSGTLWAIGNGIAGVGGIFTPYIIGILTPNQTLEEWRLVFWIVFGVAIVTNLYFILFASAEVQDWNDLDSEDSKDVKVDTVYEKVVEQKTV